MEIVAAEAAPVLPSTVAQESLLEMAAVIRTLFGVALHPSTVEAPTPAPPLPPLAPLVPATAMPVALALPVPSAQGLPVPDLARPLDVPPLDVPGLALPVLDLPDLDLPELADPPRQAPLDRHSLSLLQEIAFLDD